MKPPIQLTITAVTFLVLGIFISRMLIPSGGKSDSAQCEGEEFMPFIKKFHTDMVFQKGRTLFPLYYSTSGNNNDTATYLLERADWMPLEIFGTEGTAVIIKPSPADPCTTTVTLQGINSGEFATFTFVMEEGVWRLHAFEDYSD